MKQASVARSAPERRLREATGRRYVVTFFKTVTTDYGRDQEIRQRMVEVFANDERDALNKAKVEFCRLDNVHHWSHHADRYQVIPTEFPA